MTDTPSTPTRVRTEYAQTPETVQKLADWLRAEFCGSTEGMNADFEGVAKWHMEQQRALLQDVGWVQDEVQSGGG